jgi:hypothetical protein
VPSVEVGEERDDAAERDGSFEDMIRGAIWPLIAVGAVLCLGGCPARRATRATVLGCIERAEGDRRTCLQGCEGEFEEAFVGCYGHNACTDGCETRQLVCQGGPLHDLTLCGEAAENPRSCQTQLHVDLHACAGRPDRAICEDDARRQAAACWRACRRTHGPALQRCAETFQTCLDGCIPR